MASNVITMILPLLFKVLLLPGTFFPMHGHGYGAVPGDTLVTAGPDSISSNFVLRTGDLFWQSGWNYVSTDRMSVKVHTGYYGYEGPQPQVVLDGIPVDTQFMGVMYPQHLPVAYSDISKLETGSGPGVRNGISYQAGVLNIDTAPVKEGFSLNTFFYAGHQGGEPGPWVYDEEKISPNIERFGPGVDVSAVYKSGEWYGKGLLRYHNYDPMDLAMQLRIKNMRSFFDTGEFLDTHATTMLGMGEAGYRNEDVSFKARAAQSSSSEYLFFHPLGREIPTEFDLSRYTASVDYNFDEYWVFRTMFQKQEKEYGYRRNLQEFEFGYREDVSTFRLSFLMDTGNNRLDIGSEFKFLNAAGADSLDEGRRYATVFIDGGISVTPSTELDFTQKVIHRDPDMALESVLGLRQEIGRKWEASVRGFYSGILPETASPANVWTSVGYTLYDRLDVAAAVPDTLEKTRTVSLSSDHKIDISDRFSFHAGISWIRHLSFSVPWQPVQYDSLFNTSPGIYTLFENQSGERYELQAGFDHSPSPRFSHRFRFGAHETISGDPAYTQYWEKIPSRFLQYSLHLKPFRDLEIDIKTEYRPETQWDEFDAVEGRQTRSFHEQYPLSFLTMRSRTPEHVDIDFRVAKWFWKQKFRALLMMKNLLNNDSFSHPLGVREGFNFMARFELRL